MYQTTDQGPPGQQQQQQPVLTGQPVMGQQGQPMQYFVPAGQPVQLAQGQTASPHQPALNQDEDVTIRLNKAYLKSGLSVSRVFEFIALSIAWPCVVVYSNRVFDFDGRANFFRGITIFCWVMVIILEVLFLSGINKNKNYFRQPSHCTLISLGIQVVLTILLITCSTSFVIRLIDWHKIDPITRSSSFNTNIALLYAASIFGLLACLIFLDDIRLLAQIYSEQKAKENAPANVTQQPGTYAQQQVGAVAQLTPQPGLTGN